MFGLLNPGAFGWRRIMRHLAALEPGRHGAARARALGTAAGGLAALAAVTTTDALLVVCWSPRRASGGGASRRPPPRTSRGAAPCGACRGSRGGPAGSTVWRMRLSPSERTVSRWSWGRPMTDRDLGDAQRRLGHHLPPPRRVSSIAFGATSSTALSRSAAMSCAERRSFQTGDGRVHDVDGVGGAERLGEQVLDSGGLDDRADRTTGDDPGTGGGRLQHDPTSTGPTDDGVHDREPTMGTLKKFFLASSTPFWIADCTSLALPCPTPTIPLPSPTTTRAVNWKRRPPLTTLATRLIETTRSSYCSRS